MRVRAPAKINLNLSITGRQDDGYHLLDSVMVFTSWGDDIIIKSASEFKLTADGPFSNIFTAELLSTNRGAPNLIVKAVYMMADRAGRNPDIHIHVTKNIPAGAGLGGGSSDAAAVMHALNDLWDMNLSLDELCAMGLELGAELPICLHGRAAKVTGIGDIITPVEVSPLHLLIVWPDTGLLTKDVFAQYRQLNVPFTDGHDEWMSANNDLTPAAIELCPEIGELLSDLAESDGCILSRMSGSGSACFGVFDNEKAAKAALPKFKNAVVTGVVRPLIQVPKVI